MEKQKNVIIDSNLSETERLEETDLTYAQTGSGPGLNQDLNSEQTFGNLNKALRAKETVEHFVNQSLLILNKKVICHGLQPNKVLKPHSAQSSAGKLVFSCNMTNAWPRQQEN